VEGPLGKVDFAYGFRLDTTSRISARMSTAVQRASNEITSNQERFSLVLVIISEQESQPSGVLDLERDLGPDQPIIIQVNRIT
jgi:hypothetical protein